MTITHRVRHLFCRLVFALICSACAQLTPTEAPPPGDSPATPIETPAPPIELSKAQLELEAGVASYENGSYKMAARQIQSALSLGLPDAKSIAQAHKYLAFMHCVGGRTRKCREEFTKALDADSEFSLTPAEAGHPTWGPVFRKLKTPGSKSPKKSVK